MKLLVLLSIFLISSFHPIGKSEEGTLNAKVIVANKNTFIYLDVDHSESIDSLIIHTDIWQIKLARASFTDECLFEINTAETTVLKQDLIKSFELRIAGKSKHYKSTDQTYIRKMLLK